MNGSAGTEEFLLAKSPGEIAWMIPENLVEPMNSIKASDATKFEAAVVEAKTPSIGASMESVPFAESMIGNGNSARSG